MSTTTLAHKGQPLMQAIAEVYQRYLRGEIGVHHYSSLVDELIEQNSVHTTANAH
ncbi:hypothetical protein HRE53_01635 [Acaryochloris sp. 'Moss Beach']|uniref:hypothetical protein n=1 Tax=Acaryochloris TaxID=155977 RepID=UPI001BB0AEBC|nr:MULTISPECIES: hypothetical protein [Acaryochloris]QUY40730.1 hypothetical protein I1H34_15560 [Acaryochloris marina S15]UJB69904.1 hypothetical protein HRE53_01635 [Acaryochloris sp. 'Moss Beach']